MTNQQEFLAIFIPSFLILVGAFLNWQGNKRTRDELRGDMQTMRGDIQTMRSDFVELRHDVRAETESLRTIAY